MKRYIQSLLVILTMLVLSACWSAHPLEDIAIITSLGIDKIEEGYQLSFEVIVPSAIAGDQPSQRASVEIINTEGSSVCEAFRSVSKTLARYPLLAHANNVVVSEQIAREGLTPVLDCLVRDDNFRFSTSLFIAKEQSALDVLRVASSIEPVMGTKLMKISKQAGEINSVNTEITILDFVNNMVSKSQESIVPGVYTDGDPVQGGKMENVQQTKADTMVKLTPPAVFKGDKLVGWLDDYTSKGVHLILGEVKSTMIEYQCDEGLYYVIEYIKGKIKQEVQIKDKKPKLTIDANITSLLCQVDCNIDLTKQKNIEKLQKDFEKVIKKQIEHAVSFAQKEVNSDILGVGKLVHRKDPNLWKEIEKDWDQYFETMEVEVRVKVTIEKTGSIKSPLIKDTSRGESMQKQIDVFRITPFQLYAFMVLFILGVSSVMYFGGEVKQDSWIVVLISGLIAQLIFIVIYGGIFLLNKDAENTQEFITKIVGKKIAKLVFLLYVLYYIFISFFVFRDITEILITYVLPGTPREVIKTFLLIVIYYGVTKGIETIFRLAEMFFWTVIISMITLYLFLIASGVTDFNNLSPMLEHDVSSIIKATPPLFLSIPFGELVVFLFLFPIINKPDKAIKTGAFAIFTTTILLTIINMFMLISIGPYFAQNSEFPAILMIRMINIGNFIQRLDAIYILVLLLGSVFQLFIYGYTTTRSFQIVFNTKQSHYFYFPVGIMTIIGSFLIGDSYVEATKFGLTWFPYYVNFPFEVIIPSLFLFILMFKKLAQIIKNKKSEPKNGQPENKKQKNVEMKSSS